MKLNYVICDAKIIDNEDVNELDITWVIFITYQKYEIHIILTGEVIYLEKEITSLWITTCDLFDEEIQVRKNWRFLQKSFLLSVSYFSSPFVLSEAIIIQNKIYYSPNPFQK